MDLFQTAFRLKRDEQQRQLAFMNVENNDEGWITNIRKMQDGTLDLCTQVLSRYL